MKRIAWSVALVFLILFALASVPVAQAAPPVRDCGGATVSISSPQGNTIVSGVVSVVGTVVTDPGYGYHHYKLEFSSVGRDAWVVIVNNVRQQVGNGTLARWDTSPLPDGAYALRLLAVDRAAQYCEAFAAPIYVQRNASPPTPPPPDNPAIQPLPTLGPQNQPFAGTPTRTPRGTPSRRTPTPTATATPPPAPATLPGPTAKPTGIPTIAINIPTDAPKPTARVSETPTARSRNVAGASSLIPFDLSSITDMLADAIGGLTGYFVLGIKVTASVFLLIGAVVFLRRTI